MLKNNVFFKTLYKTVHFIKDQTPREGRTGRPQKFFEENNLVNARTLGGGQRGLRAQKTRVSSLFSASGAMAAHLEAVGRLPSGC